MAEKLLTRPEVLAKTGLGRTTQWDLERKGLFPRRRQVGRKRVAWLASEVSEWIRSLPAVEDGADAA